MVTWGIKGFNKVWWHIKAVRTEVVVFRIISFHSMPFEAGPILCMLASAKVQCPGDRKAASPRALKDRTSYV